MFIVLSQLSVLNSFSFYDWKKLHNLYFGLKKFNKNTCYTKPNGITRKMKAFLKSKIGPKSQQLN